MIFRLLCAIALLLALVLPSQAWIGSKHGGMASAPGYVDFCSASGPGGSNCVYAYSVVHRLVPTATNAGILQRASDHTQLTIGFLSTPPYLTNAAAAVTFCASTICGWQTVYDQTGSGCDVVAQYTDETKMLAYGTYGPATGIGAVIPQGYNPIQSGNGAVNLLSSDVTACGALRGSVAKTIIVESNNAPSSVGGMMGLGEDAHMCCADGSMFAVLFCRNIPGYCTSPGVIYFGFDEEQSINTYAPIPTTPADGVGIVAGGVAPSNLLNIFWNGTQILTNSPPTFAFVTEGRMNIGCTGDWSTCGPVYFRDMIFLRGDQTSIAGSITTYLANLYAAL